MPGSGWSVQGARLQVLGSGWRNTRLSARNSSSLIGYYGPNLVARARDPLWEESWGCGKKPKSMHGIHCIPLLSDPVH